MTKIQYTIRNIPPAVDSALHKQAQQTGKSLNQTVVDVLTLQTLGDDDLAKSGSFDWLFGKGDLGPEFDEAIKDMRRVDKKLWQ